MAVIGGPSMVATFAFVVALAFAPEPGAPQHDFAAPGLDAAAVEAGLRARVGDTLDDWQVSVEPSSQADRYEVEVRDSAGRPVEQRSLELIGDSDEARSRELAASLALIIEAQATAPDPPARTPGPASDEADDAPPALPRGFVVVEPHLELGSPNALAPGVGLGLGGGGWLVNDRLQLRGRVRWTHAWSGEVQVHGLRTSFGVGGGFPIGRWWLGGLVMPGFAWTRGVSTEPSSRFAFGGELSAVAQFRLPRAVFGVRVGTEATLPAVLMRPLSEAPSVLTLVPLRWMLSVELGFGI